MLHVHLPGRGEGWPANPLGPEDSEEQGDPLPPLGPLGLCLQGWALDKLGQAGSHWARAPPGPPVQQGQSEGVSQYLD